MINTPIMTQKTILYDQHLQCGGKMVDFAGWLMPLHYGSQINEHLKVRADAGVFDVSHMTITDIKGPDAKAYLRYILANDIHKINRGSALYSCMLNANAGIIDDLIVYYLEDDYFRIISNASTRQKVLGWYHQQQGSHDITIIEKNDLAIIAIQGPQAIAHVSTLFTDSITHAIAHLKPFQFVTEQEWLYARTGYTGENGLEIILPIAEAKNFWQALMSLGIQPCGLGARDTLRLEAGLNLYGSDMDETTTPLESNLAWTIGWDPRPQNFIGYELLLKQKQAGIQKNLVGLVMNERAVLRSHQKVIVNDHQGEITSGSFSPSLQCSIALARIPITQKNHAEVLIRDKHWQVEIVKPPFVRQGKKVFQSMRQS